ncbi:MAG TPA: metallophosphoesterase family protein [Gaiellaceae bacterium]|nr:metallophosphoesterase family protein [Gaiellaceae bacterium]
MKVAALYDIHAMPWALDAVLAEVEQERVDAVVFGGDYLYGPYPRETVATIRSLDAYVLRGNCEDLAEEWERAELAPGEVEWLQSLPLAATVDGVLYCHAAPASNTPITTAITPDEDVLRTFAAVEGTVVIGHTHHQFDRRFDGLRVVNAGSVGMPYEGEVAAFWTLLEDGEPSFRRTPFDVDLAVAATRRSAWPHASGFVTENLLAVVVRDEAIEQLESRRT